MNILFRKNLGKRRTENGRAAKILEYSYAEMIGKENTFFMDKEGMEIAGAAVDNRVLGTNETVDIPLVTKSGKRVWVTMSGSTILDGNGAYSSGLAMVTDITERRAVSEKLASSESRLIKAQAIAHVGSWEIDLAKNVHHTWLVNLPVIDRFDNSPTGHGNSNKISVGVGQFY